MASAASSSAVRVGTARLGYELLSNGTKGPKKCAHLPLCTSKLEAHPRAPEALTNYTCPHINPPAAQQDHRLLARDPGVSSLRCLLLAAYTPLHI